MQTDDKVAINSVDFLIAENLPPRFSASIRLSFGVLEYSTGLRSNEAGLIVNLFGT
jgi:hypothetical protein